MAESISLSNELIRDMIDTIGKHDASAQQDMMVNLQYLTAVAGYLAADYPGPADEREDLLQSLTEFMRHVCDQRSSQKQSEGGAAANVPQGSSVETDDPAVGIWRPE
jgi:hypothetical protein